MSEKDGGPAFPRTTLAPGAMESRAAEGMSLRDWFAGQALAGLLASPSTDNFADEDFATESYHVADAMLRERDK